MCQRAALFLAGATGAPARDTGHLDRSSSIGGPPTQRWGRPVLL